MERSGIGKRIAALRQRRGWSQATLSEVAGVASRTVQRAEGGSASLETLQALANALGCEVAEFQAHGAEGAASSRAKSGAALLKVSSGKALAELVGGAGAFEFDHDDVSGAAADAVAGFIEACRCWGGLWPRLEAHERVRAASVLQTDIDELEKRGFAVFAGREARPVRAAQHRGAQRQVALVAVRRRNKKERARRRRRSGKQ